MSFSAEYNRHGFLSRLHLEQVNKSSRAADSGHASTLICKRHNDSGAGFPRSDGRLPSLPEPILRDATRVFRVSRSTNVQIFVSPGCKNGLPLISSSGVGSPSRLSSSVSFHSSRRAFGPALQRCSFSSSSQPEFLLLAGFLRSFGSCPFSHGSQALFSVLGTFVGHLESCPLAVSCEALFPLLTGFVGPFDNFPFAVTCEALFPLLAGFVGPSESCSFALSCEALFPLLAAFVDPFDSCPFAFLCAESLFPLLACFVGSVLAVCT